MPPLMMGIGLINSIGGAWSSWSCAVDIRDMTYPAMCRSQIAWASQIDRSCPFRMPNVLRNRLLDAPLSGFVVNRNDYE